MKNFMNDFGKPIIVLMCICLVMSAALAFTNDVTAPIIEKAAAEKAEAARMEVLPDADAFTEVTADGLPAGITAAYKANNGAGFVFMMEAKGYGGTMSLICGIDADGKIVATKTLSHAETSGLGSKTADEPFRSQFAGKDAALDGVDTITGATISSKAYIGAVNEAFAAYEMVKGA